MTLAGVGAALLSSAFAMPGGDSGSVPPRLPPQRCPAKEILARPSRLPIQTAPISSAGRSARIVIAKLDLLLGDTVQPAELLDERFANHFIPPEQNYDPKSNPIGLYRAMLQVQGFRSTSKAYPSFFLFPRGTTDAQVLKAVTGRNLRVKLADLAPRHDGLQPITYEAVIDLPLARNVTIHLELARQSYEPTVRSEDIVDIRPVRGPGVYRLKPGTAAGVEIQEFLR